MELWIRSQDKKKLLKANEIHLGLPNDNEIWMNKLIVGEYKTKERALEILDEIQKQLIAKKGIITTQNKKGIEFIPFTDTVIIYEMPKE